eukprot:TRINITY_DN5123_c0_g1_i6.p1 TRINITY_DN5123_c0_g1~~TRINITY_DN5123_c0_g1_i6.p1  ORF type:complete len:281 (+),score=95.72 TRINITY_DN5123_c0_g1_i6:916-1758(+)
MEMQKRVLNYRPTWNLQVNEPVAGNYYPINAAIQIKDAKTGVELTLLNDRSQGGSSIHNGQVELMIQRRCLADDARGVGEPLTEMGRDGKGIRVKIRHTLLFTKPGFIDRDWRSIQFEHDSPNVIFLAVSGSNSLPAPQSGQLPYSLDFLPPLVKSFVEAWGPNTFLIRLQNLADEKDQVVELSPEWKNLKWQEKSLTANQDKSDLIQKRLVWNNQPAQIDLNEDYKAGTIALRPQEIRTFIVSKPPPADEQQTTLQYVIHSLNIDVCLWALYTNNIFSC